VALRRQEVVLWANSPSREKTLITKEKEEKIGQINTMKTNSKPRKDLRLATWNVRSLYRPEGLRITIKELRKYKIAIAAIRGIFGSPAIHRARFLAAKFTAYNSPRSIHRGQIHRGTIHREKIKITLYQFLILLDDC
jgi:hypothetical protein